MYSADYGSNRYHNLPMLVLAVTSDRSLYPSLNPHRSPDPSIIFVGRTARATHIDQRPSATNEVEHSSTHFVTSSTLVCRPRAWLNCANETPFSTRKQCWLIICPKTNKIVLLFTVKWLKNFIHQLRSTQFMHSVLKTFFHYIPG